MASIWSIDGNDIYIDNFSEKSVGQVAEINPINSTSSTFHTLFEPTNVVNTSGTVIGESVADAIRDLKGQVVSLISDLVPGGFSVLVSDVQVNRITAFGQTVDGGFPFDAPIYKISLTLRPQ